MNKKLVVRGTILLFFTGIIIFFLYLPRAYDLFVSSGNVLVLHTPRALLAEEVFEEFERKTGIHVRVTYFDTNEEMLAKFKINRGVGCDIVVPSDYMVELMIRENLLQPLDYEQINTFSEIDKRLMGKFFDPENKYTLPLSWLPFGIAFNKEIFSLDENVGWDIVFDPEVLQKFGDHKVAMTNDAREAVFLASIYLFGNVDNFTEKKLRRIKDALVKQKPIVEAYSEVGAKYLLLSDIVPLAVLPAARVKEMGRPKKFGFVIPREGSIIDILNLGILATSKKADMAHKLIDFLLSKEIGAYNFEILDCNPSNRESYKLINKLYSQDRAFFPDDKTFKRLHTLYSLHNKVMASLLEKVWFLVKSA
jgi:spermidine/putrescine transport system substrate-binding protein